ncbi:MAG: NUDIX domain-containing protein [bacterium]|nr:NUDIX domain-containing protein [bacterium]
MKFTTLCYIEKDDKFLMLHRTVKENDANKDKWIGLGGKFEPGESPEDCLLREIKEEAGITLTSYRFRGIVTFVSDEWEDEYMCLYTADQWQGEISDCDEGELLWVKKERIPSLNLWEGDRIFLDLLATDEPFFSLKLQYQKDNLVDAVLNGTPLEFFDLRDQEGNPTGKRKARVLAHQDGDLHGTSHIWVARECNNNGYELLLQKRSATKDAYPGCYDVSSAGHLDIGETYLEAAIREAREELGLLVDEQDLEFVGMHDVYMEEEFYHKPFRNHELSAIYLYKVTNSDQQFTLQKEEVEAVRWFPYTTLLKEVQNNDINHCLVLDELKMLEPYLKR